MSKKELITDRAISWKKMLQVIPVKNESARFEQVDSSGIKVTVQKKKPKYLIPPLSWIIKMKLEKTIQLDEIGAFLLNLCDGKNTIENIIDSFAEQYQLSFHEARVSITDYIKSLMERGILAIASKE